MHFLSYSADSTWLSETSYPTLCLSLASSSGLGKRGISGQEEFEWNLKHAKSDLVVVVWGSAFLDLS